jgi:hypothetical protein
MYDPPLSLGSGLARQGPACFKFLALNAFTIVDRNARSRRYRFAVYPIQ